MAKNSNQVANVVQPTLGKMWRKARVEGYVIALPSSNNVRIRRVGLDQLIANGEIPDLLTPIAAKTLWEETYTPGTTVSKAKDEVAATKDFTALLNVIAAAALMEPKIVDDPQADDEISIEDLHFSDKLAIFMIVTQPEEALRRFRVQQAPDVELVYNGESNHLEAEQTYQVG